MPRLLAQLFDLAAVGGRAVGAQRDLFTADHDPAGCRGFQKVDAAQHGRFARTRPADDRHHIAFACAVSDTPFSTSSEPKDLCSASIRMASGRGQDRTRVAVAVISAPVIS